MLQGQFNTCLTSQELRLCVARSGSNLFFCKDIGLFAAGQRSCQLLKLVVQPLLLVCERHQVLFKAHLVRLLHEQLEPLLHLQSTGNEVDRSLRKEGAQSEALMDTCTATRGFVQKESN